MLQQKELSNLVHDYHQGVQKAMRNMQESMLMDQQENKRVDIDRLINRIALGMLCPASAA
jgi:hypothetical protein